MFDVIRNLIPYHTTLCSEMRLENIVEKENALLPFPKRQIIDTSELKSLQTTILYLMKMGETSPNG